MRAVFIGELLFPFGKIMVGEKGVSVKQSPENRWKSSREILERSFS